MKEIKVIDLLNMIAEGKKVPKFKFEKRDSIWEYNPLYFQFQSKSSSLSLDIMPVLNESVEIIEEDKYDYTIRQISKMIASGDLKEIYSKYLSECPIGFMQEQQVYDYLTKKDKSKEDNNKIEKLKRITKCIGTDEDGTYYTDEYTIPELVVKIEEIIDKLNNME